MQALYSELKIENKLDITSLYTVSKRRFDGNYSYDGEAHDFIELVCVTDGAVTVTAEDKVFELSAGNMTVHSPNEFHRIRANGAEFEMLIFSFKAAVFPETIRGGTYGLTAQEFATINELYAAATDVLELNGVSAASVRAGKEAHASILVKRLETLLLSVLSTERIDVGDKIRRVRDRTADNYKKIIAAMEELIDKMPQIADIAAACGLSVPTLEKTVARHAGHGAMKHFMLLKMKRAKELLTDRNVKETAYLLGFSEPSYFSAVFKKHNGYPPSAANKKG